MKVSGRTEVLAGLVLPLLLLTALVVVGIGADQPGVAVAFMAAVPMLAAMIARTPITAVVALATVLAAAVTSAIAYGSSFADAVPILVGVITGAGIAVVASQVATPAPPKIGGTGPHRLGSRSDRRGGLRGRDRRAHWRAHAGTGPCLAERADPTGAAGGRPAGYRRPGRLQHRTRP